MASGSQICSGNMALLPAPPMNISPSASGIIAPAAASSCTSGVKGERPGIVPVEEDADEEPQVGEARHDKRLLRGRDGLLFRVIETDEQVGATPTNSQKRYIWKMLVATTSPIMLIVNNDRKA